MPHWLVLLLDGLAALVAVGAAVLLLVVLRRRRLHRGGGAVDCSLSLRDARTPGAHEVRPGAGQPQTAAGSREPRESVATVPRTGGWAPGIGRYGNEAFHWYRLFSLSPRPRRVLTRAGLVVAERRAPTAAEVSVLGGGLTILVCRTGEGRTVQLAMSPAAVTGFRSWAESAPPGSTGELPELR